MPALVATLVPAAGRVSALSHLVEVCVCICACVLAWAHTTCLYVPFLTSYVCICVCLSGRLVRLPTVWKVQVGGSQWLPRDAVPLRQPGFPSRVSSALPGGTRTHTYTHAHTHTHTCVHALLHVHTCTHACMHTHVHPCARALTCTHTHIHAHPCSLMLAHTCTHAHK